MKMLKFGLFLCLLFFGQLSFGQNENSIHWVSFEKAIELNEKEPRKIFVDLYTDWCGWCKKMDKTSFEDSAVVAYMNSKYYAVKLNAEKCDTIRFKGRIFTCQTGSKTNDFAFALMNNKLDGFPSSSYLNEKGELLSYYSGYIPADNLLQILSYFGDDQYLKMSWEEYQKK